MSTLRTNYIENLNGDVRFEVERLMDVSYRVSNMSELVNVATATLTDEDVILSLGYHSPGDGGGGYFYWDANEDKANHNGGTIIDPNIAFPTDWSNTTQQSTWFTAGTGAGCWKRIYSGVANVKYFGAKGDGVADDYVSIQNTINNNNNIIIPKGLYLIQNTIETKGKNISFNKNAFLIPNGDFNIIRVNRDSKVINLQIDLQKSNISTFTKSCIILRNERFQEPDNTIIENPLLIGISNIEGNAITLEVDGNKTGSEEAIVFIKIINANIYKFKNGINLHTTIGTGSSFINSNVFENFFIVDCYNALNINNEGSTIGGNNFKGHIQASSGSNLAINCINSSINYFNLRTWDWHLVGQDAPAFYFNSNTAYNNILETEVNYRRILDEGNNNFQVKDAKIIKDSIFPPAMRLGFHYPKSHLGNQDDFLCYANKKFNVTMNNFENVDRIFQPDKSQGRYILPLSQPAELIIDFNTILYGIYLIGIVFSYDGYFKDIKLEYYENSIWKEINHITDNSQNHLMFNFFRLAWPDHNITKIKFTFDNPARSDYAYIQRVYGFEKHLPGNAYLVKGGGDIYGNINFNYPMNTSSKDPTTVAPDTWFEVEKQGTKYFIPGYLA